MGFKVRLSCTAGPLDPVKTDMIAVFRQFRLCVRGAGIRAVCPCGRGAGIRTMGILPVYLCFLFIFFLYTI